MAELITVIVAPATTCPAGSTTVPFNEPRVCCDWLVEEHKSAARIDRLHRATLLLKKEIILTSRGWKILFFVELPGCEFFVRKNYAPRKTQVLKEMDL